MAAACIPYTCSCTRNETCRSLRHRPLVWVDSFGLASDWHVNKISAVVALHAAADSRNQILCGIELVVDGAPLPVPAIGDAACIFISGSADEVSQTNMLRKAAELGFGEYDIRFAFTNHDAARQRIGRLLGGLQDAHVGALPGDAPPAAAEAWDAVAGCAA